MIEHLVLFKLKDDTPQEKVEELISALQGLAGVIDGIVAITAGKNFTDRGKGFNFALRVTLKDKESLALYGPHPAHQKVKDELVTPNIEDILAIDYEF